VRHQLTLVERFGPLDRDSTGLREGALLLFDRRLPSGNWIKAV